KPNPRNSFGFYPRPPPPGAPGPPGGPRGGPPPPPGGGRTWPGHWWAPPSTPWSSRCTKR
ncbi:hypothetical protein EJ577_00195, partial [Pseudomonas aeruginosa]